MTDTPAQPDAARVTRLVADPHARGHVNVFLDGRFAFRLSVPSAARVPVGTLLTAEAQRRLQDEDKGTRAVNAALRFVGPRPRSAQELANYLTGKGFDEAAVDHAGRRLRELGLLDDLEFARWWVGNRMTHRPRGLVALRHELRARGVARATLEEALAEVDEASPAEQLARSKAVRFRHLGRYEFNQRVGAFLERRGFAPAVIRTALDAAWDSVRGSGSDAAEAGRVTGAPVPD